MIYLRIAKTSCMLMPCIMLTRKWKESRLVKIKNIGTFLRIGSKRQRRVFAVGKHDKITLSWLIWDMRALVEPDDESYETINQSFDFPLPWSLREVSRTSTKWGREGIRGLEQLIAIEGISKAQHGHVVILFVTPR